MNTIASQESTNLAFAANTAITNLIQFWQVNTSFIPYACIDDDSWSSQILLGQNTPLSPVTLGGTDGALEALYDSIVPATSQAASLLSYFFNVAGGNDCAPGTGCALNYDAQSETSVSTASPASQVVQIMNQYIRLV